MWEPPQRLVHESLLNSAAEVPDKQAVVDEYGSRTWAKLADDAARFARLLQDSGLERGDRVALYLDNTALAASAIFGTLLAGGAFTFVNPQTKAPKLAFILNDSGAKFLVAEAHSSAIVEEAVGNAPGVQRTFTTDAYQQAIAAAEPDPRAAGSIPLDMAALVYTSGTTGDPKGVMMSHGALVFSVDSIAEYLQLTRDDRILSILPMAFTYGLSQLLLAARLGMTLSLERSFTFPAKTLARIREEQPTVFPAVPTVYATILSMSADATYPSLRCLTNAAAGLPPALHEGIARVFPNADLYRMYGQTECIRICYLDPALVDAKPTSVGKAIPGTEAFVLDDLGRPVEAGETGVLHVRGPHLMMGYWNAPELTAEKLKQGALPGERVMSTHDHFTVDADGDLYFVDRSDDIIKTRGEKVSSVEVENVLHDIDGVRQAAVIGVPDELLGQAVKAFVLLDDGAQLTELEVIRACRAKLENFMVPKEVVFAAELPHTDSGKIRKKTLLEAELAGKPDQKASV
ncbi:MAG TPA: class I adenylate-forming enzyme family protein [Gaiellaceae bacterium]